MPRKTHEQPSVVFRKKRQLKVPAWAIEAWQVTELQGYRPPQCLGTYLDMDAACAAADAIWIEGDRRRRISVSHICGILLDGKFYRCHFNQTKYIGQAPSSETYAQLKDSLQRIEAAVVSLSTFAVTHEGGIEACTRNIVESIVAASRKLEALRD